MTKRISADDVLLAVDEHYVLGSDMIASDIAHALNCSDSTARRWANKLVDEGLLSTMLVQVEGVFKLSPATAYHLTEAGQKRVEALQETHDPYG